MSKIVFMLEEPSMKELLDKLLPQLLPQGVDFMTVPHEGKQDLERSIRRKLRAWNEPGVRFIIVRDQDGGNCFRIKGDLLNICKLAGRPDSVIRIVCNELESWFLGDLVAVAAAYDKPRIARLQGKRKYRNPDNVTNAAEELKKLVPEYQKLQGARRIANHIDRDRNISNSFRVFLEGVLRVANSN
ncbi:DUF4276 family protein [Desulfoscipio sp. XC116]|uniref:DUF4276 family protein n=1 Tax=Desulfoscipio sp. XC116 TaxID=3144975 RepID=UPI00325BA5EE